MGGAEADRSPFSHPELTSTYVSNWVSGAKSVYGIDIDYVGIWNERNSNGTYVKALRQALDARGFERTRIVAKDGNADICEDLAADKSYADAGVCNVFPLSHALHTSNSV